ncbi:hypothetical protein [Tunturiibacter empetritectus]|uniref:hypothetical protein n=1 Tax=Tunturiibacter empetritectus TaxID=3069691 RepID=UPI003D9B618E
MKTPAPAKTNAARLLDTLGIPYELRPYEVDPDDLTALSVARKIGLPRAGLQNPPRPHQHRRRRPKRDRPRLRGHPRRRRTRPQKLAHAAGAKKPN